MEARSRTATARQSSEKTPLILPTCFNPPSSRPLWGPIASARCVEFTSGLSRQRAGRSCLTSSGSDRTRWRDDMNVQANQSRSEAVFRAPPLLADWVMDLTQTHTHHTQHEARRPASASPSGPAALARSLDCSLSPVRAESRFNKAGASCRTMNAWTDACLQQGGDFNMSPLSYCCLF